VLDAGQGGEVGDEVFCGEYKFKRSFPCGTLSSRTGAVDPVDIASIVYCYEFRDKSSDYKLLDCKERGVKYVPVKDRNHLIEYLKGDIAISPVTTTGFVALTSRKRNQDGFFSTEEPKPPDEEGDDTDDFLAYLRKNERTHGGRNARLRFAGNDNAHRPEVALQLVEQEKSSRADAKRAAEESKRSRTSRVPRTPVVRLSLLEELSHKTSKSADHSLRPYIILPRSSKALLNLLNGQRFFEKSEYKAPEGDVFGAEPFDVTAKINGRQLVFRVCDDVSHFGKMDWLQTVAVFIDGSKWQFNKWPFRDLADLFATIKGFHLSYDNHATPRYTNTLAGEMWSAAQKDMVGSVVVDPYPVVKYTVKRSTLVRQDDGLVAYQFWKEMEAFLLKPRIAKFSNQHMIDSG
jgi:hypothetical protein